MTTVQRLSRRLVAEYRLRRDPVSYFRAEGFQIGEDVRLIGATYGMLGHDPTLTTIGNAVTVSVDVLFLTHDGAAWVARPELGPVDLFGAIQIEDGAFIGARAILLPGVTIGRGSVVATGAVVSRSVPESVIVAGSPARIICSTSEWIERNRSHFHFSADLPPRERDRFVRSLSESQLLRRPLIEQ